MGLRASTLLFVRLCGVNMQVEKLHVAALQVLKVFVAKSQFSNLSLHHVFFIVCTRMTNFEQPILDVIKTSPMAIWEKVTLLFYKFQKSYLVVSTHELRPAKELFMLSPAIME